MGISGDCVVVDIDAGDGELPTSPVPYALSFTDLSYSVRKRGGDGLLPCLPSTDAPPSESTKKLLDGISGEARDGDLLAVMGSSGSGKSTLLDALAGRISRESLRGRVDLNGEPLHGRCLRAISAYVMQDDLLYPMLTVLRRVAQSGSVVVMIIHQPSARILNILDRLLFLSRGRTVYSGTPSGLKTFFSVFGAPTTTSLGIAESVSRGKLVAGRGSGTSSSSMPTYANPLYVEVWVLMKRAFTNKRRMPELFVMRLGTIMVTGFILATIFWRLDDTPKGAQERLGFLRHGDRCRRHSTSAPTRCRCSSRSATSTSGRQRTAASPT
uniref:Uncharacterized protein n=1 Tax=Oryza punctata TaxID=4537 RepID=A0A0E0LH02_ORYPU